MNNKLQSPYFIIMKQGKGGSLTNSREKFSQMLVTSTMWNWQQLAPPAPAINTTRRSYPAPGHQRRAVTGDTRAESGVVTSGLHCVRGKEKTQTLQLTAERRVSSEHWVWTGY